MQEIKERCSSLKRSKKNLLWGQAVMLCLKTHVLRVFKE